MAELIDRMEADAAMIRQANDLRDVNMLGAEHILKHWGRRVINEVPTIDAAPVVHARWIQHNRGPLKSTCSACNTSFIIRMEYGLTTKYCPTCGARMDADAPDRGRED